MKLIDKYIIKQFITHFLFALISIIFIFIIIDLMENLDDFIDHNVAATIVFRFYIFFTPEIIMSMIPVAVLLSSLFTTGKLSNQNELTAMKSGGISLYRFIIPFIAVGIVMTALAIYFSGWIVPIANKEKIEIERVHLSKHIQRIPRYNIYLQDTPTRFLSLGYIDDANNAVSRVSIQEFSGKQQRVMSKRYDARRMLWDSETKTWILRDIVIRNFENTNERVERVDTLNFESLVFTPEDLIREQLKPDEMNYRELRDFIDSQIRAGQDPSRWLVEYYSMISFPFASLIVILFGVPFSAQKKKGGIALQFAVGVLITFLYLATMEISQALGHSGQYNPLLMAWFPNILFLSAGLINLLRVRK